MKPLPIISVDSDLFVTHRVRTFGNGNSLALVQHNLAWAYVGRTPVYFTQAEWWF